MTDIIKITTCGLAFGIGALLGCVSTSLDPNHCMNNDGDAFCLERYPDRSRPYCGWDLCFEDVADGCVEARPEAECHSACGDRKKLSEDPDCEGVAETGTETTTLTTSVSETTPTETTDDPTLTTSMSMSASESETEVTSETDPTTGPTGCVSSLECTDPGSPVCVDDVCSACGDAADGDAACEAKDPLAPACREDGECVSCTPANPSACDGLTPVCDAGSSACVGCTYHEQCAVGACEMATGACFTDMCVTEVDENNGDTIAEALGDGCVIVLRAGGYGENVVVNDGAVVAIVTMPNEVPVIGGDDENAAPTIDVSGGSVVYMQGVEVSGNGGVGVLASGGSVWLDRSRVVDNSGGGVVLMTGADGHVRNCFVGGSVDDVAALDANDATVDITYSTVGGGFATAAALRCEDDAVVNVRNSLLVARTDDPEVDCTPDSIIDSLTEMQLGPMNPNWFGGYTVGNFSLNLANAPDEILTAATWTAVDPLVDIDGDDARPNVVGASDVAGADVP